MSVSTPVRGSRTPSAVTLPSGFPNKDRAAGSEIFRHVCNDAPASTFARWLAEGRIMKPVKIGARNVWPETYIATVAREGTAPKGTYV